MCEHAFVRCSTGTGKRLLALLAVLCCLVNSAVTPKEKELAQAAMAEVEAKRKEVQRLSNSKQFDMAIRHLQDSGRKWLSEYGPQSWPMAEVSRMLADTYLACGDICDKRMEAAELYEKSATVTLAMYGESSPQYAATLEKTADTLVEVDAHKRALPYFKKLVKQISVGLGEDHEALRNVRMKLANTAMRTKSYKTARKTWAKLLQGNLTSEDEVHCRLHQAVAVAHLGESEFALEHIKAAKQLVAAHFGKEGLLHAKVLNAAGGVLERLNRDEEALQSMEEAHDVIAKLVGPDEPMTVQAKKNVEGLRRTISSKNRKPPTIASSESV